MSAHLATASPTIRVNDEPRPLGCVSTLLALLRELGLAERKGVAVAVNKSVVTRAAWPTYSLRDGDCVLVIRATQGG